MTPGYVDCIPLYKPHSLIPIFHQERHVQIVSNQNAFHHDSISRHVR